MATHGRWRGQGYDGAGNMAGKYSGVARRIERFYEKAVYVHCNSHVLNPIMASSCQLNDSPGSAP